MSNGREIELEGERKMERERGKRGERGAKKGHLGGGRLRQAVLALG